MTANRVRGILRGRGLAFKNREGLKPARFPPPIFSLSILGGGFRTHKTYDRAEREGFESHPLRYVPICDSPYTSIE